MYDILTDNVQFLELISNASSYLHSHPHVAAQSELAEIKQVNQAQLLEKEKLKQRLEQSETSLVKVCSLLYDDSDLCMLVMIKPVGSS